MAIVLNWEPLRSTVPLTRGSDFFPVIVAYDRAGGEIDWPDGTEVVLELTGGTVGLVTWTSTIDGPRATFDVPAADVQEMIDAKASTHQLVYVRPGRRIVLMEGPVGVTRNC